MIKIGVNGMNVLKGLEKVINKNSPILVMKTNDDIHTLDFLKKFNYKLLKFDLEEFDNMSNNIFCVRK